jgi:putative tricarboxylic transport membrane protein
VNRKTTLIEGLLLLILGFGSVIEGIRLDTMERVQLLDVFGPGRYNILIGFMLIIVGFAHLVSHRSKTDTKRLVTKDGMRVRMIGMVLVLAVYIFLINIVGYLLASMIFFFLIFRITGFRSWPIIGGLSIGISIISYLIFVYWLHMIFPPGVLFE